MRPLNAFTSKTRNLSSKGDKTMPAKINVTKDIKKAFDATSRAVEDLALYGFASLGKVTPQGVYPRKVFSNAVRLDDTLSVTIAYILENIPAHGRWSFKFVFMNNGSACAVTITRTTTNDIHMKSCNLDTTEICEKVKELAEL